jgi:hypothetical protein
MLIPSGGALGPPWRRTRAVSIGCNVGLLLDLDCFGFFWAPWYTFCVPRGIGGLGFLCMLETLCAVLMYSEAFDAFFFIYTLIYQKKIFA